ncbi:MAG: hypothetical protein MPJ50_14215 [Pirellulales bacterium]|nr:hypothetical protein [Pirellulales bacterium]
MDTIWISNGDKNSRAVVQGRILLEDPVSGEKRSTESHRLPSTVTAIYKDLTLDAGALLQNLNQLKFSTPGTVPFRIRQDEIAPESADQGDENSTSNGVAANK